MMPYANRKMEFIKQNQKIKEGDNIIKTKSMKKHKTLEERYNEYKKLPKDEKGSIEPYDWQDDVGKEILD